MKRSILCLLELLLILISCDTNLCNVYGPAGYIDSPRIHSVKFSPKTAKVGDTVTMIIEKDNWNISQKLDFNRDFEITDDGKIKYIGSLSNPHYLNYGRIATDITRIVPTKENYESFVEVTEYVSIMSKSMPEAESSCETNSCAYNKYNKPTDYDSLKKLYPGYEILIISFKVPANAKSGYIRTTDPTAFARGCFSEEKLIIVDENGNEITE